MQRNALFGMLAMVARASALANGLAEYGGIWKMAYNQQHQLYLQKLAVR